MTRHDAWWSALMVLVVAMGAVLMIDGNPIAGAIQMVVGTLSLGSKLVKLVQSA
jgi:hypothetical protein